MVSHARGDIGIAPRDSEESAEVPGGVVFGESHDREADDAQHGVEDDDEASHAILVPNPGGRKHHYAC